jgi:hypothetical protein
MYDNSYVLSLSFRVTGGELFEDIVAREYYSEADARWAIPIYCYHGYCAAQRGSKPWESGVISRGVRTHTG